MVEFLNRLLSRFVPTYMWADNMARKIAQQKARIERNKAMWRRLYQPHSQHLLHIRYPNGTHVWMAYKAPLTDFAKIYRKLELHTVVEHVNGWGQVVSRIRVGEGLLGLPTPQE